MNRKEIQRQIDSLSETYLAKLSDRKLKAIEDARLRHISETNKRMSTRERIRDPGRRKTKLTQQQAEEVRAKYSPFIYGKARLAEEYGVSTMTIVKIVRNQIFKTSKTNSNEN
jgi:hypothetical protein